MAEPCSIDLTVRDRDGQNWRVSYAGTDSRDRFCFRFVGQSGATHLIRFSVWALLSATKRTRSVVTWSKGAIVPAESPDSWLLWQQRVAGAHLDSEVLK